jgi:hypothetical protein
MRTFTKNTALSEQGRGVAWHVLINARHGRWTAWERQAVCESALSVFSDNGKGQVKGCFSCHPLRSIDNTGVLISP